MASYRVAIGKGLLVASKEIGNFLLDRQRGLQLATEELDGE